jgi:hypothetical protein
MSGDELSSDSSSEIEEVEVDQTLSKKQNQTIIPVKTNEQISALLFQWFIKITESKTFVQLTNKLFAHTVALLKVCFA